MKHHISHKIQRHFLKNQKHYTAATGGLVIAFLVLTSVFFLTHGTSPQTSELAFTAKSILGNEAGSVIPASGESTPDSSYNGTYNSSYDGTYNGSYNGSYDSSYDSTYNGTFNGSYNSTYNGSYDSTYESYPPPAPSNFSLTATPRSIVAGAKVTLQWSITNPNNTCRIITTPICAGTCDAAHTNAAAALQSTLDTGTTDSNDQFGASRSMTRALQTTSPAGSTKAQGKKTLQTQYSTSFKLQCGPAVASTTVRVIVTSANEG